MGPHPGRRPILTLKGAAKATVASSPPPVEKVVNGPETAATYGAPDAVRTLKPVKEPVLRSLEVILRPRWRRGK